MNAYLSVTYLDHDDPTCHESDIHSQFPAVLTCLSPIAQTAPPQSHGRQLRGREHNASTLFSRLLVWSWPADIGAGPVELGGPRRMLCAKLLLVLVQDNVVRDGSEMIIRQ